MKDVKTTPVKAKEPSLTWREILLNSMFSDDQLAALLADERVRTAIARAGKKKVGDERKRPAPIARSSVLHQLRSLGSAAQVRREIRSF